MVSGQVWSALYYILYIYIYMCENRPSFRSRGGIIRNDRAQELINFFTRNDHYDQVRWNTILEWKEIVAMSLVSATGRGIAQPSREFPDQCLSDGSDVNGHSTNRHNPFFSCNVPRKVKFSFSPKYLINCMPFYRKRN